MSHQVTPSFHTRLWAFDSLTQLDMCVCVYPSGELVEINTNLVLFCFFKPAEDAPHQERCLILKFLHTRLLTQSEQFANELTRHLDICAPNCRILRQKVCLHLSSDCYVATLAD